MTPKLKLLEGNGLRFLTFPSTGSTRINLAFLSHYWDTPRGCTFFCFNYYQAVVTVEKLTAEEVDAFLFGSPTPPDAEMDADEAHKILDGKPQQP